jgi:2-dehydro-3-deoxyphosphogluconate aldolase/(4S)-4-hydroxy-2-oxoglutarate aldolase
VNKQEVRSRIEDIGIIPAVRVSSAEDALFAAEAVSQGGISMVELTVTMPHAHNVISHLVRSAPEVIVGAGGLADVETARGCLDAGAKFLASDGLDPELVNFAVKESVVVIPGTLTPSEVMQAWKMGPDFVKVVPCAPAMGGEVNQQNVSSFILAGAVALGIGSELIPREAIRMRQADRIAELARRFASFVSTARGRFPVG